jgi:hypothetical protein
MYYLRIVHSSARTVLPWLLLLATLPASALVPPATELLQEAVRYRNGEGVTQDYARAYELYCVAVLQGNGEAAYHLGAMYLNGWGRTANEARAAGWFKQAEQLGDVGSGRILQDHLNDVPLAVDPDCPLPEPAPDRTAVTTWVKLLAPYYRLKPELVLSLIQVESNFDADAKSPKNARGLMQLMPDTAERFGVENISDPLQNLQGGLAYLRWLYDYFSGDVKLMLAGYNAGEDAVDKHGGIPPYDETRKYVRRIVHIYANYIRARRGISKSSGTTAGKTSRRAEEFRLRQVRASNDRALSHKYIPPSSIQ